MNIKAEYRKDMRCVYLDVYGEALNGEEPYEEKLLHKTKIPGLVVFCRTESNLQLKYAYTVTGYQPLEEWLHEHSLDSEMIRRLLRSFIRIMETLDDYLLNPDNLVIESEYIFFEPEAYYARFIYLPGYETDFWSQMRCFSEKWLDIVAYEEKQAVLWAYDFYKRVHMPQCVIQEFNEIFENKDVKEESFEIEPDIGSESVTIDSTSKDNVNKNKEQQKYVAVLYVCCPLIVMLAFQIFQFQFPAWMAGALLAAAEILWITLYRFVIKNKIQKASAEKKGRGNKEREFYCMDEEQTDVPPQAVPWILKSSNDGHYSEIFIDHWPFVIGKVPSEVDYVLDASRVSHIHARFDRLGWGMTVADMDSSNGTFLNNEKLIPGREYGLSPGDKIRFGNIEFICQAYPQEK